MVINLKFSMAGQIAFRNFFLTPDPECFEDKLFLVHQNEFLPYQQKKYLEYTIIGAAGEITQNYGMLL